MIAVKGTNLGGEEGAAVLGHKSRVTKTGDNGGRYLLKRGSVGLIQQSDRSLEAVSRPQVGGEQEEGRKG